MNNKEIAEKIADALEMSNDPYSHGGWTRDGMMIATAEVLDSLLPKRIPVSERLPELSGNYLVSTKCSITGEIAVEVSFFYESRWRDSEGDEQGDVTHWMPLPAAAEVSE